jgi:heptosyltransferase-2
VIGGAEDTPLAAEIVRGASGAVDATGRLSLLASAELLRRCAILVTNDSAPLHLASAMNTPTVALFGPTVPAFGFGPLATRASVLGLDALPCRPCDRHGPARCPLGHHRCMRDLAPAAVAERVRALLSNQDLSA